MQIIIIQIVVVARPLFALGKVAATRGALQAMEEKGITPAALLTRHISGDWGNLPIEDREANQAALRTGERLFSSYNIGFIGEEANRKIWIITEHGRTFTTLLLPDEY